MIILPVFGVIAYGVTLTACLAIDANHVSEDLSAIKELSPGTEETPVEISMMLMIRAIGYQVLSLGVSSTAVLVLHAIMKG